VLTAGCVHSQTRGVSTCYQGREARAHPLERHAGFDRLHAGRDGSHARRRAKNGWREVKQSCTDESACRPQHAAKRFPRASPDWYSGGPENGTRHRQTAGKCAMSFGQRLLELSRDLDLSQRELTDCVGCAAEMLRKLDSGQRRLRGAVDASLRCVEAWTVIAGAPEPLARRHRHVQSQFGWLSIRPISSLAPLCPT
jgi:hypothetical protein